MVEPCVLEGCFEAFAKDVFTGVTYFRANVYQNDEPISRHRISRSSPPGPAYRPTRF